MIKEFNNMLDDCIKAGYTPDKFILVDRCVVNMHSLEITFVYKDEGVSVGIGARDKNIHRLFSQDSGIMEFVEWDSYAYNPIQHIHNMSMFTAEEKIQYFLANAKLPTKSE